jgi:sulfur carrier protein ThiS
VIQVNVRARTGATGTGPLSRWAIDLPDGTSLKNALDILARAHGVRISGNMALVTVNGRRVGSEHYGDHVLADGDVISVIQALVGG